MKRELGIARCGLACCLCSENISCKGCDSGECPDKEWCENRKCSIKPYAFTEFVRRYGEDCLLDCLERNENRGIVYHREGINGDYDDFDDVETLIEYIRTGRK